MTTGIGGSSSEIELEKLRDRTDQAQPISDEEFEARLAKARHLMEEENLDALYLHAGTNLYYFTGTAWSPSERMVGALLTTDGRLAYICPKFEERTLQDFMRIRADTYSWEEHESPYLLLGKILDQWNVSKGRIGLDESTKYFTTEGIRSANPNHEFISGEVVTSSCRRFKSEQEIALIQTAMDITMDVIKGAAALLRPGISTAEVTEFIHHAHIKSGFPSGSYFCIVLFGTDSSFPHGVQTPRNLARDQMVLIDTGGQLEGYLSDITRTFVYGSIHARQRQFWDIEQEAQAAAFAGAQLGRTCGSVDDGVRKVLEDHGLGPDYKLPGLPHRSGHGIGLDIHEAPYLVRGNPMVLEKGMCFSDEPMLCLPEEFGVRLEDHIYMTDKGPQWFTQPAISMDDPFGLGCQEI